MVCSTAMPVWNCSIFSSSAMPSVANGTVASVSTVALMRSVDQTSCTIRATM